MGSNLNANTFERNPPGIMTSNQSGSVEEFNIYNATLNSMNPEGPPRPANPLQSLTSLKQLPHTRFNESKDTSRLLPPKTTEEDKLFQSKPEIRAPLANSENHASKGNSSGNIRESRTSESYRSSQGLVRTKKNKENIEQKSGGKVGSGSSLRSGSQAKARPTYFFNGKSEVLPLYGFETKGRDAGGLHVDSGTMHVDPRSLRLEPRQDPKKTSLQLNGTLNPSAKTSFLLTNSKSKLETKSRDQQESSFRSEGPLPKKTNQYFKLHEQGARPEKSNFDSKGLRTEYEKDDPWRLSFEKINEIEEENTPVTNDISKGQNMRLGQLLNLDEQRLEKKTKRGEMGNPGYESERFERGPSADYMVFEDDPRRVYNEREVYPPRRRPFHSDKFRRYEKFREQAHFEYDERLAPKHGDSKEYFYLKKLNLEKLSPLRFESRMRRDARYYKNRSRYEDHYDPEFEETRGYPLNNSVYVEKMKKTQMMDQYWFRKQKELDAKIKIYEDKLREMGYDMYQKRRSDGDWRDRHLIRDVYEKMPNSHQVSANPSPKILPSALNKWGMAKGKSLYGREASALGKRAEPEFLFPKKERVKKKKRQKWEDDDDEEWTFEEEQERRRRKKKNNKKDSKKGSDRVESHAFSESKFKPSSQSSRDQAPMTEVKKTKRKRIRRRKPLVFKNNNPNEVVGVSCKCKKSRCLKLYCECFANGGFCHPSCKCENCCNKEEYKELRELVRKEILQKNPKAFQKKFKKVKKKAGFLHSRGCNCKKTQCLKNYCECFSVGIGCSSLCRCVNCKNKKLDIAPKDAEQYFEKPERKRRKPTLLYEYILDQIKEKDVPDLQSKVELALTNDYERILDEIKNNYDPRKLQSHIKKVSDNNLDASGSPGSKIGVPRFGQIERRSGPGSSDKGNLGGSCRPPEWEDEDKDVILDEDDDEDDLANTMEKFKRLRQE